MSNSDPKWQGFYLNISTEIIGIVLTVFGIEASLNYRNKKEHEKTVKPLILLLLNSLQSFKDSFERYLIAITPSRVHITNVNSKLANIINSASNIFPLLDEHNENLAVKLVEFIEQGDKLVKELDDLSFYIDRSAADVQFHLDKVRKNGQQLIDSMVQIKSNIPKKFLKEKMERKQSELFYCI